MRLYPLHASLMSLALFALAGPAAAAAAETEQAVILAQAETPAAEPEQPQAEAEQPPPAEVQPEPQPEPQQEAAPEPQPEPQQQAAPEPAPQESSEVALFLQSVRPASELSDDELRRQMQQAMALAETEGLSKDQRRALRDVIREARAELKSRADNQAAETQAPAETQQETPPEAQQQAEPEAQPQPQVEPPAAEQQQQAQPPVVEEPPQEAAKTVEVDPALEVEARALIEDNVDARDLNRRELRKRLSSMRELLASEKLSPQTSDALRQKLAAEREVLRSEVSAEEGQTPPVQPQAQQQEVQQPQAQQQEAQQPQAQQPQQGGSTVNNNVVINNTTTITNTEIQVVLNDRRPPDLLEDDELVRRIDIYRDVVRDDRYDMEEREAWRRALERDRRYLRRQMLAEREEREARLRRGEFELNIEIYNNYDPGRDYQDDVFAAEVEDEELADVLAAPPRRKVERRYTVDEIERSSTARDSVARIEIDTVNFGFGEGFLREEEIDKLDRIARVLERILARNPDEVFLIEGHTDAVGSAGSNLQLSRERAAAVKEALTTYYVIPAENLKTVGLGERYLKIPTLEAEAENRRVSLARITSLVSRAD